MSGFDWEGVLGADDPEEYMNILEDKIAEADDFMRYRNDDTDYDEDTDQPKIVKPHKPLPYKTSLSVNVNGVDEYVNLGMGIKAYKFFHRFADDQKIPLPEEVDDLRNQVEKLYPLTPIINASSLFVVPSLDFNLSNCFYLNNEFDTGHLSGNVNIISFLIAGMMEMCSRADYVQKRTNNGHYFCSQFGPVKTIYIFNGIFRKEMKEPLEDYVKQLRKHYGSGVKVVLIALTEAQSNAIHFRLNADELAQIISYDNSIGFITNSLVQQLPQDLKNKGLLLYNSNPSYSETKDLLTYFNNIQSAKKTLAESVDGLFMDIDCTFDSYTSRISSITLHLSSELQDIYDRTVELPF